MIQDCTEALCTDLYGNHKAQMKKYGRLALPNNYQQLL